MEKIEDKPRLVSRVDLARKQDRRSSIRAWHGVNRTALPEYHHCSADFIFLIGIGPQDERGVMSAPRLRHVAQNCLLAMVVGHLLICPFNKVEESFNMQAIHDTIVHKDLSSYDHQEFPGVVPRTFIGAITVGSLCRPIDTLVGTLANLPTRHLSQIMARLIIGLACWLGFRELNAAVALRFGESAATWVAVCWALQFHLPFYLSRTLPNVFALGVVLLAQAALLKGDVPLALGRLTLATCIFRCDVVIFLAPLTLLLLLSRRIGPLGVIKAGVKWGIPSILASVAVDSVYWGRLVWPEGEVLLFNTVDNRSSEWGEMAWHWYLTSALPRALSGMALFIPLGLVRDPGRPLKALRRPLRAVDTEVLFYLIPAIAMVALYSILPHKELRFVFPALPLFNLAAGVGMSRALRGVWGSGAGDKDDDGDGDGQHDAAGGAPGEVSKRRSTKSVGWAMRGLLLTLVVSGTLATIATTGLATLASWHNYPGGVALRALHLEVDADDRFHDVVTLPGKWTQDLLYSLSKSLSASVHVGVNAAMSGVSRFGQRKRGVSYSKQEERVDFSQFDFLITAEPSKHLEMFEVKRAVKGYDGIFFKPFWRTNGDDGDAAGWGRMIEVRTSDKLYVMARRMGSL